MNKFSIPLIIVKLILKIHKGFYANQTNNKELNIESAEKQYLYFNIIPSSILLLMLFIFLIAIFDIGEKYIHLQFYIMMVLFLVYISFSLYATISNYLTFKIRIANLFLVYMLSVIFYALIYIYIYNNDNSYFIITSDYNPKTLSPLDLLYYSFVTFSTVGFGDITPKLQTLAQLATTLEIITSNIIIIFTVTLVFSKKNNDKEIILLLDKITEKKNNEIDKVEEEINKEKKDELGKKIKKLTEKQNNLK